MTATYSFKNKDIIKKWIKALRSEKYKQGQNFLRSENNEFCCLGVLCDIVDPSLWKDISRVCYTYENSSTNIPISFNYDILSSIEEKKLIEMNDIRCFDFNKIADYIEENILQKNK